MADTFKARVSMTPIVTKAATTDGDAIDVIHHDINKTLGGKLEWNSDQEVGATKWWYAPEIIVTTTAYNAIDGGHSGSTATYTNGDDPVNADDVRMAYIEHLGVDQNDNPSAAGDYLFIYLDGGTASEADALMLEPNESIVLKFKLATGVDRDNFQIDMAQNTAKVKIVAICDDGA
tara:strand:+ start:77 stop:604 length:528 start_codon:yes stop_codon:yes gene_type:complete